jgi:predicted Fe-S protein YdhL (DUF1289 family)
VAETTAPGPAEVASPCRRACRYRAELGICDGCGRTLAEIGGWAAADAAARAAIVPRAAARLASLAGTGRGEEADDRRPDRA